MSEEDIAKLVEREAEREEGDVSLEGYTLEHAKLDRIIDVLELGRHTSIAVAGAKSKEKFKPTKRPQSAQEKILEERKWEYQKQANEQEMKNFGF